MKGSWKHASIESFDEEAIEVTLGWIASQFLLDEVIYIFVKFSLCFFTSAEVVFGLKKFLAISRSIILVWCFFPFVWLVKAPSPIFDSTISRLHSFQCIFFCLRTRNPRWKLVIWEPKLLKISFFICHNSLIIY